MNNIPALVKLTFDSLGVTFRERDCIVCHKKFLQRMKINKQGKPVRIAGFSDKFCSAECKEKFHNDYLHNLRAGNEHYMEYNRKRMAAKRYEQYKERAKPLYDELKSLILSKEDDMALGLITDISIGRIPLKKLNKLVGFGHIEKGRE